MTVRPTRDIETVRMTVVALSRKLRKGVTVLTARTGQNAIHPLKGSHGLRRDAVRTPRRCVGGDIAEKKRAGKPGEDRRDSHD